MRRKVLLAGTLAALVVASSLAWPLPGSADTLPMLKRKLAGEILVPLQAEVLSGRSWLVSSGQDPAVTLGPGGKEGDSGGGVRFQAAGAGAVALIPYRDPSTKFSRTVLLSRDLGRIPFQTEPNLAIDPKDPNHLIAGLIDYNRPGISTYVSIDGGATWDGPYQPKFPRQELSGAGDPTLAFDRRGNLLASQISLDVVDFRLGPVRGQALVGSASVSTSTDGGYSWLDPVSAGAGGVVVRELPTPPDAPARGTVEMKFVDKPWMSLGPSRDRPDRDAIYITYTAFVDHWNLIYSDEVPVLILGEEEAVIEMVRSEDGGQTWSRPVEVSPRVRLQIGEESRRRVVQGAQPVVAADGTLHIAWFDSTDDGPFKGLGTVWVASSRDGGRTFSRRQIATTVESGLRPRSSSFRLWATGFPQIAAGPKEEIYVAFTGRPFENPEDDGDVYLVRSLDGGRSWERPVRVNDDGTGRMQFFPAISVDPNGDVHMMWGDTRDDRGELTYHIYYSVSKDRGLTWERNSRVTDFPSNPNYAFTQGRFIGDYFSIKATKDDVYMLWADGRLGQLGGTNQKIGFARKRLMPVPSMFLSPPSGPSGRDVVIQGHNYQPDSEVFVEMGGTIIASGRTGDDGTISLRLFVPIAGEGASTVRLMDSSGNVATGSFFTDFGFDSFQKAVTGIQQRMDRLDQRVQATLTPSPTAKKGISEGPPGPVWLWLVVAVAVGIVVGGLGVRAYGRVRKA